MKTFKVPVWFSLRAKDKETAWEIIIAQLTTLGQYDQLPEYIVDQPVQVDEDK